MINHVVLFKLKEYNSFDEKESVLDTFRSKLLSLKGVVPELKYIEVGKHYMINSPSYDICLITHFESSEDLKKYQVHPEHLKIIDFVQAVTVSRAAVDYEF
jgi:hypothetical protein